MRERWLQLLLLMLLVGFSTNFLGCRTPRPDVRPPKGPEEYKLPPPENRYSDYPTYPKDPLGTPGIKPKLRDGEGLGPSSGGRPGMGGM